MKKRLIEKNEKKKNILFNTFHLKNVVKTPCPYMVEDDTYDGDLYYKGKRVTSFVQVPIDGGIYMSGVKDERLVKLLISMVLSLTNHLPLKEIFKEMASKKIWKLESSDFDKGISLLLERVSNADIKTERVDFFPQSSELF